MIHLVRLSKYGSSLGIAIPPSVRDSLHLGRGDQLVLTVERGRMVLVKVAAPGSAGLTAATAKAKS